MYMNIITKKNALSNLSIYLNTCLLRLKLHFLTVFTCLMVCVSVEGGSQGREGELVQSRIKNILV